MDSLFRNYFVVLRMTIDPSVRAGHSRVVPRTEGDTHGSYLNASITVEAINEYAAEAHARKFIDKLAPPFDPNLGFKYGTWETLVCVAEDEDTTRSSDDAHASGC